jgi:hypothetical protein
MSCVLQGEKSLMGKFLAIVLAAILGFLATMALSHVPRNVMVYQDRQIERGADMTSFELNDSDVVEVDGIQFRTVMPERVIRIPSKQPGAKTQVSFGIQITNQTANPRYFLLLGVRPEFRPTNKQKMPQSGSSYRSAAITFSDFKLLMPGEHVTFLVQGYFEWFENKLGFVFLRKDATYWLFGKFEAGTYSMNVMYENPYPAWEQSSWGEEISEISFNPMRKTSRNYRLPSEPIKIEDVWVGEIFTSPLEFNLVQ